MMTGRPDWGDRLATLLVALVALGALANGLAMLAAPMRWYEALPTLVTTGPPNRHFLRDIGLAYCASGAMLGYAAGNLALRWRAALAGNLWLLLHGILHVVEVAAGICAPGVFIADAPGVLGPPLLVLAGVGIMVVRRRIAPAGLPSALVIAAASAQADPSDIAMMRRIAAAPGSAWEKYAHFMPSSLHRHAAPPGPFHAARLAAVRAEDCGPCALIAARQALADGLSRDEVNGCLAGAPSLAPDLLLSHRFGAAVATQSADADALGDAVERRFGADARLEMAMTAALARSYPAIKRGLGLARSCALAPPSV